MRAQKDSWSRLDHGRLGNLFTRLQPQRADVKDGSHTLSPWAIAVSVLALLGFGVLVGTSLGSQTGTRTVLLSAALASRSATTSTTPSAASPPATTPEATPTASTTVGGEAEGGLADEGGLAQEGTSKAKKQDSGTRKTERITSPVSPADGRLEQPASGLPPIDHVFLIVLSELGYNTTFGAGPTAPYLSTTLPSQGELIESYYAVAGGEPANGIALISGQGPTEQTLQGCQLYSDIVPASTGTNGQTLGSGCVYPSSTLTLANQLEASGKTWKAYIEGLATSGSTAAGCPHPQLGGSEAIGASTGASGYEGRRNPFIYFHSLIDRSACASNDVEIGRLASDLASPRTSPSFAYIAPDACDDGSPTPCSPGAPAGVAPAEGFLRNVVGEIERSEAYEQGGLIAITSDQAPQSGPDADSSGCCVSTPYPNLQPGKAEAGAPTGASRTTGANRATGASSAVIGGGKVGLLLISKYVKAGSLNVLGEYDHFSLLLSIEELFGLKPLGYADAKGLLAFDASVYNWRRP